MTNEERAIVVRRAEDMRTLSPDQRAEAIAESANVVGFDRFRVKAKNVWLAQSYKKAFARRPPGGRA